MDKREEEFARGFAWGLAWGFAQGFARGPPPGRTPLPQRAKWAVPSYLYSMRPTMTLALTISLLFSALLCPAEEQTGKLRLAPFPALGYAPETKLIYGGYLQAILKGDSLRRDSQVALYAIHTQNGQAEAGIIPEFWFAGNSWLLSFELSYQNWPGETYGIGIDSHSEDEATFTVERGKFEFLLRRRLSESWFTGVYALHTSESFTKFDSDFPYPDHDGQETAVGLDFSFDSRNSTLLPSKGMYHQIKLLHHLSAADFPGESIHLDLRSYSRLPVGVLALQGALAHRAGSPGFRQLSQLGEYLRAHGKTRFVDRNLLAARAEFRHFFHERLGAVLFVETGTLADEFAGLAGNSWKPSVGLGGRFRLIKGEALTLRLDLAFGDGDSGFYLRLGEAF